LISWDAFDYAPGTDAYNDRNPPLAGGDGWRVGWQVGEQMGSGFWGIDAASPLTFANLRTTGHYLNHRASDIGRQIGLTGGWSASVQGNLIGKPGLVVWLSALVRIDADAPPNPIFLTLHADAGFGYHYYNSAAQVTNWIAGVFPAAGVNQWSLWDGQHIPDRYKAMTSSGVAEIRAAAHPSAKSFVVGKTNLVVVKVEFAAGGDRVSLYIDPPSLGGAPPAQPDATLTASGPAAFCAFAFAGGDDSDRSHPQACALDEVRIGTTFAAVTPTQ
jgi:hypothetical protein